MQHKQTILVVDDDNTELDIMSNVLSTAGYRVLVAENGEIGYQRALFARPDLILLDIMMPPGIDGYETCKRLRANERTKSIPVIFKSCIGDQPSVVIDGFELGVDNIITKPCNLDSLLGFIKSRLVLVQNDHLKARFPTLSSAF